MVSQGGQTTLSAYINNPEFSEGTLPSLKGKTVLY